MLFLCCDSADSKLPVNSKAGVFSSVPYNGLSYLTKTELYVIFLNNQAISAHLNQFIENECHVCSVKSSVVNSQLPQSTQWEF